MYVGRDSQSWKCKGQLRADVQSRNRLCKKRASSPSSTCVAKYLYHSDAGLRRPLKPCPTHLPLPAHGPHKVRAHKRSKRATGWPRRLPTYFTLGGCRTRQRGGAASAGADRTAAAFLCTNESQRPKSSPQFCQFHGQWQQACVKMRRVAACGTVRHR